MTFDRSHLNRMGIQLLGLLGLSILVAFALTLVVTVILQRSYDQSARDELASNRVAELIETLAALAPNERRGFSKSASSRTTRIKVDKTPTVVATARNERSENLRGRVKTETGLDNVNVSVLSRAETNEQTDARNSARNREVIAISVELPDGKWLNFQARQPLTWFTGSAWQFIWTVFGLTFLSVLAVAAIFTRRIVAPVRALAVAANQSATGQKGIKVDEAGPQELREAARAFNKMQNEISRFDDERKRTIAALGHDLRTPLTSLRIRAENIEDSELRQQIVASLDDVTAMADGLVTYARVGLEESLDDRVDLAAVAEKLCEEAEIPCQIDQRPHISGGAISVARAIRNVVDNAIAYGENARLTLATSEAWADITIEDDGPGIEPELLDDIFEPFVRGEGSRSTETGGVGLGLANAREIVLAHGGTIRIENIRAGGTRVKMRFPMSDRA